MTFPDEDTVIKRIEKILPDDNRKMQMLLTLFGVSGVLTEHIITEAIKTDSVGELPAMVAYAVALISANMITLMEDNYSGEIADYIDLSQHTMSEQGQEAIYRKMKYVVEMLYKSIQEKEKENP